MKRTWKTAKHIILFCLLTGAFCACQEGQRANTGITPVPAEGTETPLPTPEATVTTPPEGSKTPSVTETPLPTPTPEMEGARMPIDEVHFTSAVFREFIAESYDTDSDGFLSGAERGAVTEMQIGNEDNLVDEKFSLDFCAAIKEECLDGFEYFPNLTKVNIFLDVGKVVIRNHPALQHFGGYSGIKILQIENCAALTEIRFYHCRADSLSVSGTPLAVVSMENCLISSMDFDADVTLWVWKTDTTSVNSEEELNTYMTYENGSLVYVYGNYDDKEEKVIRQQRTPVEFTNRKEPQFPFSEEYWTECLKNSEFGGLDLSEVQISEREALYNEKGQKGYAVRVIYAKGDNYYEDKTFIVYADEMPVVEQFVFRPSAINQIEGVEYSPNRGVCIFTKWDLAFVYRSGEEEQILDVDRHKHYCVIGMDGDVKAIPESQRWSVAKGYDSLLRFITETKESIPGEP